MYLVDKYNDIRVLLQFFDEHLHALLELSAVFGSSHHSCHIEGDDAFVEEHGRTVARGNHLGQALDDSTLSDTWFTYQDGVVLLATAENLDDALYLAFTTDTRVELRVESLLCQVGTEVVEYGCLRLRLFGLGCGGFAGRRTAGRIAAASGALLLFIVFFGQSYAILDAEHSQRIFIVHVVHFQYLFGTIVGSIVQDGQQHMLFLHTGGTL